MARENGFNGGIQEGSSASSNESVELDGNVRSIAAELERELSHLGFTMLKKMPDYMRIAIGSELGCSPDGGIWMKDGNVIATFEAKHQGNAGNAYERACKNVMLVSRCNPNAAMVFFATGEGSVSNEKNTLRAFAKTMLWEGLGKFRSFDTLYSTGQSWFTSRYGFTKENIKNVMRETLLMAGGISGKN